MFKIIFEKMFVCQVGEERVGGKRFKDFLRAMKGKTLSKNN